MKKRIRTDLFPELKKVIKQATVLYSEVIQKELGPSLFRTMAKIDLSCSIGRIEELRKAFGLVRNLSQVDRIRLARAMTLRLEVINACEGAFRTNRLEQKPNSYPNQFRRNHIIYVLTAHPTEARSPGNIDVFHSIQRAIQLAIQNGFDQEGEVLRHLFELAWRVPIVRHRKPSVADEAETLYKVALRKDSLEAFIDAGMHGSLVRLQSWVGGDKDGHPGVDEKTLFQSLQLSRRWLISFVRDKLKDIALAVNLLGSSKEKDKLGASLQRVEKRLNPLRLLRKGDNGRVERFRAELASFSQLYQALVHSFHPELKRLHSLFEMFPALVIPIEMRESSDVLLTLLDKRTKKLLASHPPLAIERMLSCVGNLTQGKSPTGYLRSFIVSMTQSDQEIILASKLVKKVWGKIEVPIVPLFEQAQALKNSCQIVARILENTDIRHAIQHEWGNCFEVMLGYSDSSKENGVVASRVLIARATQDLNRLLSSKGIHPIFFHGAGGSVDRGGGSIRDQIAWWPKSSLECYKATIQGEMVDRLFSSPPIIQSQVEKLSENFSNFASHRQCFPCVRAVREFGEQVSHLYHLKVSSPEFLELIERATPYRFLNLLRIGSRPTKRTSKAVSISSLRAIPWVLCWTQTRLLFPTWWGVGSVWGSLAESQKRLLKRAFREDPLFRSFVKALGFTLAKVELPVWQMYLEQAKFTSLEVKRTMAEFRSEYLKAKSFVQDVTGESQLLWYQPWLGESIHLRSPLIHPLNLLQLVAFQERTIPLIRVTVTGIASGMLTTG